jgi:two-component system, sensor histidine kinase
VRSLSSELARSALEAAPDAMIIIDSAGTICYANRQTAELFGYGHDELIGRCVDELLPQRLRQHHMAHRQQYWSSPRQRAMGAGLELFGCRREGGEFPVEISLSPVQDGQQLLVAAAIRDVTERKRIENELRYLQSIADTALSSENSETLIRAVLTRLRAALHSDTATILLLDADGRHLTPFASEGLEGELGGELSIPIGRGVAGRIALSEGPVIFEDLSQVDVVSPVLRSRVRSLVGTPLKSADHLVGIVHTGSFTLRAFTQDDARLLSLAADRIGTAIERMRLQESESRARQAAESANRQKSSFLATASHDLRQPLQTLSLFNGALRRLMPGGDAADALDGQEMAIDAMSRLLNALLDISKLESGAIKPDPTDFVVGDIFDELRHEFKSLAESKGLELKVASCDDAVHSDPSLVVQILRNLLTNAIKYTRAGSVALQCQHEPSRVRLEVLDTGIGIPADKLRYIYDEFYQVGVPANSTRDGYGLGLSIVQRIANLLDAGLDVQSQPGKGTTFALTLPVGSAPRRPSRARSETHPCAERLAARVLLVEDDTAVRNATRMLLKVEGFQVMAANSMEEALQLVATDTQIDLLVTDYHLQDGKTGMDVISAVRSALNPRLKAVLLTGDTSAAIAQLSRDDHLRVASKPVNAEHLVSLLQSLLAIA